MNSKAKYIAYYLPQFHPIPENDKWWGKGFTEWTNVGKAKKLFRNHYQPRIPADLGYYDLRLPQTRVQQAKLAKEAGIDAFCYWHYYFGNGKRLLNSPLDEVIMSDTPDFPFCLAWANHQWHNKTWTTSYKNQKFSEILVEQKYPGVKDMELHFYTMLHAFKDKRYYKIDDRLVFVFFKPLEIPDLNVYISKWNSLAKKEGLPGFYFIAHSFKQEEIPLLKNFNLDAINLALHHNPFDTSMAFWHKLKRYIRIHYFKRPEIVSYRKAIRKMISPVFKQDNIFPTVIPNWDHTPRSGYFGRLFHNSTPELFERHVDQILNEIKNKKTNKKIVFIKSWNEWAEGNYIEPDQRYGKAYLNVIAKKQGIL